MVRHGNIEIDFLGDDLGCLTERTVFSPFKFSEYYGSEISSVDPSTAVPGVESIPRYIIQCTINISTSTGFSVMDGEV